MFYSRGKACSALLFAAYYGCLDIAELLIARGASVHVVDGSGETPLHKASAQGHQDLVELLIANGAQINARSKDGTTPLYMAAGCHHREIAQLLLDYGVSMEPDIAVMLGDIELVKQHLSQGINANAEIIEGYHKGEPWLNIAVGYKHRNLVELLLNQGARVNEKTGTFKFSPLHTAAIGIRGQACRDICELLIAHGADVNAEDKLGDTPLHWAARLGHQDIVELLLDCGANVNALNQAESHALFDAVQHSHRQIVESLLSGGAEVNLTDKSGYTPLCFAFQKSGDDEIIRLLVAYGADVNVQDAKGFSPLHRAVIQKNKNRVELLLAHGARQGLE